MKQELLEPTLVVQGDVSSLCTDYARDKMIALVTHAPAPVLGADLRLVRRADPARERPCHVEMTIDLNGRLVRARSNAPTMTEAIDGTVARLRRRIDAESDRPRSLRLRHRDESSWHHDDRHSERPEFSPRAADDRELIRRKTFALQPESLEDALADLELLDHDFYLFVHDESNCEAIVYRTDNGYGVGQRSATPDAIERVGIPLHVDAPPPTTTLHDALTLLDETNAPFQFFVDADTGRGSVAYRRYDGNYGVIVPR
jgi:ribosome-associated translation inhibitor RaiA